jgi:hypothetical protein
VENGVSLKIYVDGVKEGEDTTFSGTWYQGASTLRIGTDHIGTDYTLIHHQK